MYWPINCQLRSVWWAASAFISPLIQEREITVPELITAKRKGNLGKQMMRQSLPNVRHERDYLGVQVLQNIEAQFNNKFPMLY